MMSFGTVGYGGWPGDGSRALWHRASKPPRRAQDAVLASADSSEKPVLDSEPPIRRPPWRSSVTRRVAPARPAASTTRASQNDRLVPLIELRCRQDERQVDPNERPRAVEGDDLVGRTSASRRRRTLGRPGAERARPAGEGRAVPGALCRTRRCPRHAMGKPADREVRLGSGGRRGLAERPQAGARIRSLVGGRRHLRPPRPRRRPFGGGARRSDTAKVTGGACSQAGACSAVLTLRAGPARIAPPQARRRALRSFGAPAACIAGSRAT